MELKISNVSKEYDNVQVLNNLSFSLKPGVYGLLGANGAGKTTLFRVICGLMKPTRGEIHYNHKDIQLQTEAYRSILGFLPQDFRYYADFSGLKFMLYIAALKGLNKTMAKKRTLELLTMVGLAEVKNKKIKQYSGGMKQRLGIAQAMINDPEILILDEPTVGLDPKERVRFRNLISSFSKEKIVILSTHIVSDVEYISDEILVLKKGSLVNRGTPKELLKEIETAVWECVVAEEQVHELMQTYTISNQKHAENGVVIRIVSKEMPFQTAYKVSPTLEDLYLYYFREEGIEQ
ncbi:ABC transporter ATP-binding protein [Enterococcus silesiacus]|uniref:ABC transporter ATP-binding protein n=1 Tax=Enterococcus silesiacus TaxID=332949 RepID=A0A0S3KA60_9ENTE|nr:ABC transporter ATP-binding protein [Enterococcus silesiacus]ALS01201.1 ABC transporter ATP-binding protein [Enterococcus silesiacus]OJG92600.1 hypothetical protein RV15_GL003025 [Enterococcus silesiacus]